MNTHTVQQPRRRFAAAVIGATAALVLALGPATAASAHGDAEATTALALVRQAIALIVNTPHDTNMISDKITDAAESKDTEGVQIPLVDRAKDTLTTGDLHQTRTLLEQAIGARVHTGDADPVVIGNVPPPAAGEDTGTLAAIDALPGRGGLHNTEWALLIISVLIAAAGLVLSARLRPHAVHTTHPGDRP